MALALYVQVTCSVWEAGHGSGEKAGGPQELLMVMADPSTGSQRTPFVDVKWRKFQLSNWLSGGSAAHHPGTTKLCAIDVLVKTSPDIAKVLYPGPAPSVGAGTGTGCPVAGGTPEAASAAADSQQGTSVSESRGGGFVFTGSAGDFAVEGEGEGEGGKKGEGAKGGRGGSGSQAQGHVAINKWLVAQTLGAGRTRDMALDRCVNTVTPILMVSTHFHPCVTLLHRAFLPLACLRHPQWGGGSSS